MQRTGPSPVWRDLEDFEVIVNAWKWDKIKTQWNRINSTFQYFFSAKTLAFNFFKYWFFKIHTTFCQPTPHTVTFWPSGFRKQFCCSLLLSLSCVHTGFKVFLLRLYTSAPQNFNVVYILFTLLETETIWLTSTSFLKNSHSNWCILFLTISFQNG